MPNFLKILLEVISITFPIFAVIAIGFLIKRKGIIKDKHVPLLNKLTVPLAPISIGLFFKFSHIKNNIKNLSIISLSKLIIMPLIATVRTFEIKIDIKY